MEENQKPMKKIRVGVISATIWENTSVEGKKFPNITLERAYKDAEGAWKHTKSLRQNDLPQATLALQEAYRFLALQTA